MNNTYDVLHFVWHATILLRKCVACDMFVGCGRSRFFDPIMQDMHVGLKDASNSCRWIETILFDVRKTTVCVDYRGLPIYTIGSSIIIEVWSSRMLSISRVPLLSSTILRHMDKPSPVPTPSGLVEKKGSKTLLMMFGCMPTPKSVQTTFKRGWPFCAVISPFISMHFWGSLPE